MALGMGKDVECGGCSGWASSSVVANRFLMGAAHNGTAAWPRAPPRTNDEKQTGAHQVEIDLDHYRVLMPADADLLHSSCRAEHVCSVYCHYKRPSDQD